MSGNPTTRRSLSEALRLAAAAFADARGRTRSRNSDEIARGIADDMPVMMWMTASDKRCIYLNKGWLDFTGRSLDKELDSGWIESIHPEDSKAFLAAYDEAFVKRQNLNFECRLKCADGSYRWVQHMAVPRFGKNREFLGFIGVCMDITERVAAQEQIDDLSGRLINAQEEERSRLARELHDNLSQEMALLSIEIEQLKQQAATSAPQMGAGLGKAHSRLLEIFSEIHRLSYELHPSKLDRLGLAAASLSLCKEITAQQSVRVQCTFKNVPDALPHDLSLCLFRILQESLHNVAKHSGACEAKVEFSGSDSDIKLTIVDEGVGFVIGALPKSRGLGLLSMRERLRLVGGTFAIESQPLRGTKITAIVPLRAETAATESEQVEACHMEGQNGTKGKGIRRLTSYSLAL